MIQGSDPSTAAQMEVVARWVAEARSVVVLTGAGVSTDSGIPDFRGPNGIWTKDPAAQRLSSIDAYVSDPELRRRAWKLRLEHPAWKARPNPAHLALADLEHRVRLDLLVTQNIDGLHHAAGNSPDRIIEIHGTLREYMCLSCGSRGPMEQALDRVRAGEDDPSCLRCGGILKSATVSFGQSLDPVDLARAAEAAATSDLFLAVGTSLTVFPAAGLPEIAASNGARVVVVNAEPTPLDGQAASVFRGSVSTILPALLSLL